MSLLNEMFACLHLLATSLALSHKNHAFKQQTTAQQADYLVPLLTTEPHFH